MARLGLRLLIIAFIFCAAAADALAQPKRSEPVPSRAPKTALSKFNFFPKDFSATKVVDVIDVSSSGMLEPGAEETQDQPQEQVPEPSPAPQPAAGSPQASGDNKPSAPAAADGAPDMSKVEYVSSNPADAKIYGPDQVPPVRLNPEAPSTIKAMAAASQAGDTETARAYARSFVKYMQNYFFEVRSMTQMIGEAMVEQGVIDEDQWVGVEQLMDIELAKSRDELKSLFKPTHDVAMKRITPDSQKKADIYYFFTMSCSWCRYMAPDVERLWRVVKDDPNVRMIGLTLGEVSPEWMKEYREYTGLTLPVIDGTELAKAFKIGFVPAFVVVGPTEDKAYLKTGQQELPRMIEFVRRVQGLPFELSPNIEQVIRTPIGEQERRVIGAKDGTLTVVHNNQHIAPRVGLPGRREAVSIERF